MLAKQVDNRGAQQRWPGDMLSRARCTTRNSVGCSIWGYFAAKFVPAATEPVLSTDQVSSKRKVSTQAVAVNAHPCEGYEKALTGNFTTPEDDKRKDTERLDAGNGFGDAGIDGENHAGETDQETSERAGFSLEQQAITDVAK